VLHAGVDNLCLSPNRRYLTRFHLAKHHEVAASADDIQLAPLGADALSEDSPPGSFQTVDDRFFAKQSCLIRADIGASAAAGAFAMIEK
jgi:hypothetical protein